VLSPPGRLGQSRRRNPSSARGGIPLRGYCHSPRIWGLSFRGCSVGVGWCRALLPLAAHLGSPVWLCRRGRSAGGLLPLAAHRGSPLWGAVGSVCWGLLPLAAHRVLLSLGCRWGSLLGLTATRRASGVLLSGGAVGLGRDRGLLPLAAHLGPSSRVVPSGSVCRGLLPLAAHRALLSGVCRRGRSAGGLLPLAAHLGSPLCVVRGRGMGGIYCHSPRICGLLSGCRLVGRYRGLLPLAAHVVPFRRIVV
jgi:hypothetical protein